MNAFTCSAQSESRAALPVPWHGWSRILPLATATVYIAALAASVFTGRSTPGVAFTFAGLCYIAMGHVLWSGALPDLRRVARGSMCDSEVCVRNSLVVAAAALLFAAACGDDATERAAPETMLLPTDAAENAVELEIAGLQRRLMGALVAHDTATLRRLLDPGFRAHDTGRLRHDPMALGTPVRPLELTLIEVLAGGLSDRVHDEQPTVRVFPEDDEALVYASSASEVLRTKWRRTTAGWHATHLIIMEAEAARREIRATFSEAP
jgi:hypothetical protein